MQYERFVCGAESKLNPEDILLMWKYLKINKNIWVYFSVLDLHNVMFTPHLKINKWDYLQLQMLQPSSQNKMLTFYKFENPG